VGGVAIVRTRDTVLPTIPDASALGSFQRFDTEADGLIELHRHVKVPEGSNVTAAVARVRVRAQQPEYYTFDLGFSDVATVFLNGRPIFRGEASYSFDRPRRGGSSASTRPASTCRSSLARTICPFSSATAQGWG
jgi:hypothetical protein